jgi:hypothetical protein
MTEELRKLAIIRHGASCLFLQVNMQLVATGFSRKISTQMEQLKGIKIGL